MLTVVGGVYREYCSIPFWDELWGSAMRGAASVSDFVSPIQLVSCVGENDVNLAQAQCSIFGINPNFVHLSNTISFEYFYSLSKPKIYNQPSTEIILPDVIADTILMYGQLEGKVKVKGKYVIYDPQNWVSIRESDSEAEHLAIVLNRNEALLLSGMPDSTELSEVGKYLIKQEKAEVIVIKNSTKGAIVIEGENVWTIPAFETDYVWPIGSGDIFSAVFAVKWAIQKLSPNEAALKASLYTAHYCQTKTLPLPSEPLSLAELKPYVESKTIYLAGPFFSVSERWLVEEVRNKLIEYGANVFSPYHDVGINQKNSHDIADLDLNGLTSSDTVFAILSGLDPGTIFEVGYARALNKKVVALVQNVSKEDIIMFEGSGCEIVSDLATAIYKSIW